jgi:hypothetical protein
MRWASTSASCHNWKQRRRRAALHGLLKRGQPSFQRSVLGFERLHLCALRSLQLLDFRLQCRHVRRGMLAQVRKELYLPFLLCIFQRIPAASVSTGSESRRARN